MVAEAGDISPGGAVVAVIGAVSVEHGDDLLPGDIVVRGEGAVTGAGDDPVWEAQRTASVYQVPAGTSEKGISPLTAGWPARR